MKSALQDWLQTIPVMQQTVLLTAIRGPDGIAKYGDVKLLLRWYRRCVLISAMDGEVLPNPFDPRGGSFTGPSCQPNSQFTWQMLMDEIVGGYIKAQDALPHHFQMHFMHAAEILGYHHPVDEMRSWWQAVYFRLVHTMHCYPEPKEDMDCRLGDNRDNWLKRSDPATIK